MREDKGLSSVSLATTHELMPMTASTLRRIATTLLAGLALALHPLVSTAQPAKPAAGARAELRPIFVTAPEIAEGRRLAEVSCARCHGIHGISSAIGIPHIAAQRAPYIYIQMREYLQGKRPQSPMTGAVRFLSDDALVKVSAYYASQDPPRSAAAPAKAPAQKPDPVQAGRAAAGACAGCHGDAGVTETPGSPNLIGFDPKYFVAAMNAYKSGQRKNEVMKPMAAGVSEAELNNLGLFYALQKPARAATKGTGDAAAGKTAAGGCSGCHGDKGVASDPATPSLAGQDAQYLATATQAYKDGTRKDETMKGAVAELNEKTIRDIAAFYASQQPQAPKVRKPLSLAEWAERCDRCHGINGNSTDPLVPALAAQRTDWLEHVMNAYRTGARKSGAMGAMMSVMSDAEIKDLAAHYSRQTARAVSFIVLPPN
ncbi:MAG: c-type cytochrome [Betaproteobacteria bacterium]|nr:MAG: c-type cytochrome [Betaproteobacteria bacterium]